MITKRIIPCLDVKDGRVVKGVNFLGLRDVSSPVDLAAYYSDSGADELIAKPAISGGAWKTRRLRRGDVIDAMEPMPMLLQPYLPTIGTQGETSLLYFDGRLSHVVNKRPLAGEFRIQEEFGGQYALVAAPPAGALALAEQVLRVVGEPLLYARIDMLPDADGRWLLMEAELIEPDFYLAVDPAQGAAAGRDGLPRRHPPAPCRCRRRRTWGRDHHRSDGSGRGGRPPDAPAGRTRCRRG